MAEKRENGENLESMEDSNGGTVYDKKWDQYFDELVRFNQVYGHFTIGKGNYYLIENDKNKKF